MYFVGIIFIFIWQLMQGYARGVVVTFFKLSSAKAIDWLEAVLWLKLIGGACSTMSSVYL